MIGSGLDQFAEQISEISGAASKELSIEQVLKGIADAWDILLLDIVPYKDRGHYKLRSTDELSLTLEDNQVFFSDYDIFPKFSSWISPVIQYDKKIRDQPDENRSYTFRSHYRQ